jgi:hypothetical protein
MLRQAKMAVKQIENRFSAIIENCRLRLGEVEI